MTANRLFGRDILSMNDFDVADVMAVFAEAARCRQQGHSATLSQKIIASCFFEPSTRTRFSFEAAAFRLGAHVMGFGSEESLSVQKGESLRDTLYMIGQYADLIVLRHPSAGAARFAAEGVDIPVINAGDGSNQHPTQALTDMFTIQESQGHLKGLSIALVGDLRYSRTIHSLVELCSLFDIRLYLVSPVELTLPDSLCDRLKKRSVRFSFHRTPDEIIGSVDIFYLTRIQRERFSKTASILDPRPLVLHPALLQKARPHLRILHPLPRLSELPDEIDATPFACYFEQARNGLFVRQALLNMILNESFL